MKKYIFLILILILAAFLRFFNLNSYPAGLNADEAALGYNAYSLLLTGKDEHGHTMPVNLESFGDFKPAVYSYLLVPVVKTLGLTEFAVRLPSALFGVLAVFLMYVFVLLITHNSKISSISSLLLAISPWHLHFSRGAWEVNISTTLILLGVIFFIKWMKNSNLVSIAYCLVPLALSMYCYQSARVIAPLMGLGLIIFNLEKISNRKKHLLFSFLFLLLLLLPLLINIFTTDAASRLSGVGLLADEGPLNYVKELRGQYTAKNLLLGKLLHNRPVIYTIQFTKNYLSHFDGNFLFISGDAIERNRIPETGLLYFTDTVFLILGIVFLLKINNSKIKIIAIWLFVAPVASALTFQVPHALRAQNMIIPLTIITAAGIYYLFVILNNLKLKYLSLICYLLFVICYSWQFARYLHEYYIHYPQTYQSAWEYGFRDLVAYVSAEQQKHAEILVTDKYDQPYIIFLFYLKYPPQSFQGHHELTLRDKYNFSTVKKFDKYLFIDTNWDIVRDIHSTLIVAAPEDIPAVGVNIVKTIYFPGGSPAFKIVSN